MKITQLSVSSAILASVLSGCSQQQVVGGSQVSGGSQQISSGSQISSQQQVEGGAQVSTSQQQVAAPVIMPVRNVYKSNTHKVKRTHTRKPRATHTVRRTAKKRGLGLPAANPGQCFAKVKVPATYATKSRRVFVSKSFTKRVFVRAPQYRWISKKVLVRKASYQNRVIPAQYRMVSKRVMIKPAYNTWRKGHGAITRIDNMTGEIMCRVKIPATYRTVKKRVLVRPAKTLRTFKPAVYKTIKQKKRVSPALFKTIKTPARYKTQNYRVKVRGARYVWRSVLCKTNASKHQAKSRNYRKAPKQYRKPVRNTRKAAPTRQYKAAPKQQFRKAAPKRRVAPKQYRRVATVQRPVVRTNYKRQYNQSGINYQDYLKVMNAGSGSAKISRRATNHSARSTANHRKAIKKVNRKVAYRNTVNVKKRAPVRQQSKSDTRRGIVYGIQKALKAKGFDPGTMDGKMGAGTAAALKAFQSSRGLPIGKLSKDTFRALGMIR